MTKFDKTWHVWQNMTSVKKPDMCDKHDKCDKCDKMWTNVTNRNYWDKLQQVWQNMTKMTKNNKSDKTQVWQNTTTVAKYKCDICDFYDMGNMCYRHVRSGQVGSGQIRSCQKIPFINVLYSSFCKDRNIWNTMLSGPKFPP